MWRSEKKSTAASTAIVTVAALSADKTLARFAWNFARHKSQLTQWRTCL
jgi:hypothetical protein